MASNSNKRDTNLDLARFRNLQSLPAVPESTEVFTSPQIVRDGSASPSHPRKAAKRKRRGSSEGNLVETNAGPQDLILPMAADAGIRPQDYVEMRYESPWKSLQKVYELKLDGFIAVAIRKPPSCELVTVKNISGPDKERKVKMLQRIQHANFVAFQESFHFEDSVHIILDYVPLSLAQLVSSPAYPTEPQLASILAQVSYLIVSRGRADANRSRFLMDSPTSLSKASSTVL